MRKFYKFIPLVILLLSLGFLFKPVFISNLQHKDTKFDLSAKKEKVAGASVAPSRIFSPALTVKPPLPDPTPAKADPAATPSPTLAPTPTLAITLTAPAELEELFAKYAQGYNIDKEYLKKIANCESNFNPGATNGPYAGMFQFAQAIWTSTRSLMGLEVNPDLRFSAEESIKTAAFLISQNHISLWPNCGK